MRFYLDEHLSSRIAEIARGLGLDVVTALELGRRRLSDQAQLELAAQEERCLVTLDRDFVGLTIRFLESHQPHHGLLLVPRSLPSDHFTGIAQALKRYAESHVDTPMAYVIDYLTS